MRRKRIFSMAWETMKQRRLRTSLTTLGVVIGITAIVALSSLGEGFRLSIKERMQQGFELDVLTLIRGSLFSGWRPQPFTDSEIKNISTIENVEVATPVIQMGNVTLYDGDKKRQALVATAVNFTEFIEVFPDRFEFETGGPPDPGKNDTVVIGYKVNYPNETETSFTEANRTITMTIRIPKVPFPIKNYNFTVAGTLLKKGTPGLTNFDYWVFIPLDTAREIYVTSGYDISGADLIFVKVSDPAHSESIAEDIEALFPPYQISVLVPITFIRQVDFILGGVQIFLISIASIALLVAGIGIMNIMTVSVMERTREIGILKAIGAKNRTVLTMFLAEAGLIGVMGGLIGLPIGYGLAYVLNYAVSGFIAPQQNHVFSRPETERMTSTPIFSLSWAFGALAFGVIVCILFGLYPARKAAKLNPVEALRYE